MIESAVMIGGFAIAAGGAYEISLGAITLGDLVASWLRSAGCTSRCEVLQGDRQAPARRRGCQACDGVTGRPQHRS